MRDCTFCGAELDRFIERGLEEFAALLEKHQRLAL